MCTDVYGVAIPSRGNMLFQKLSPEQAPIDTTAVVGEVPGHR